MRNPSLYRTGSRRSAKSAGGKPPRPTLVHEDGRPLRGPLALSHRVISQAPARLQSPLQRAAWRLLSSRLPALRAEYEDGRRFSFRARDVMYAAIFIFGEYEPAESAMVRRLLRDGDFAVDVGANTGWFSVLMATRVGNRGSVVAIEPTPSIHRQLLANLAANPSLNVRVLPVAVGAGAGVAEIHVFEELPHGHASLSDLGREDDVTFEVNVERLDELLRSGARIPTLIKVDVEGSELDVIRGAEGLLEARTPPMWMLEVNHQTSARFGYSPVVLLDALGAYDDYRTFRLVDGVPSPEFDPLTAPHGATWLCVPPAHEERVADMLRP